MWTLEKLWEKKTWDIVMVVMYEISHANCVYSNIIASFSSLEYFTEIY